MQKDDKAYAFLLSHSSKNRIYIKRFTVSKSLVHFGSIGAVLVFGLSTLAFGISGLVGEADLAVLTREASVVTQVAAQPALPAPPQPQAEEAFDYSQPSGGTDFSLNSGGPEGDTETNGENLELENSLNRLRATANPASLPTMWAHEGKINNEFGFRRNPFGGRAYEFHSGLDIDGERGDLITAPASGTVAFAGYKGGYGNMVEIDHGNGLVTRYAHMSKVEAETGQTISRGQLVGYVGSTGRSTGPHLHFELRLDDRPINPRHFLPPEQTDLSKIEKK